MNDVLVSKVSVFEGCRSQLSALITVCITGSFAMALMLSALGYLGCFSETPLCFPVCPPQVMFALIFFAFLCVWDSMVGLKGPMLLLVWRNLTVQIPALCPIHIHESAVNLKLYELISVVIHSFD